MIGSELIPDDLHLAGGRARRWVGPLLSPLLVLLITLPALWPMAGVTLPDTEDGLNHLLRNATLQELARDGVFLPRVIPDFVAGYGYPVMNFYPPLSHLVALLFGLAGAAPVLAIKLAFVLPLLLAGWGALLLGRAIGGALLAGVMASVAYLYAPYLLLDTYVGGRIGECWALGLLPWVFWAIRLWGLGRLTVAVPAALLTLILLAHNLLALVIWPFAGLWAVVAWRRSPRGPGMVAAIAGLFVLAVGLGAWYWLPAMTEAGDVSLQEFAGKPSRNTIPIDRIVNESFIHAYSRRPQLGLVQSLVIALGSLLAGWQIVTEQRSQWVARVAMFGVGGFVVIELLASSLAIPFWQAAPVLDPVQYPWRMLGPAALLGAIATVPLATFRRGRALVPLVCLTMIVAAMAGVAPRNLTLDDRQLTVAGAARWEYVDRAIGTTTDMEYLPKLARAAFQHPADGFPSPAATATDPSFDEVSVQAAGRLGWRLAVASSQAASLRLHAFWFPGWGAAIDGAATRVYPSGPLGLVTVDVPAGRHDVEVAFQSTPVRVIGGFVTLFSLALAVWLLARRRIWRTPGGRTWRFAPAVLAASGAAIAAFLVLPSPGSVMRPSPLAATRPLDTVRLAGGQAALRSEREVALVLFWQATRVDADGRTLGVRLLAPSGQVVAEDLATPRWGTTPTASWTMNELVRDERVVRLPDTLAAGVYTVQAVVQGPAGEAQAAVGNLTLPRRAARAGNPPAGGTGERFRDEIRLVSRTLDGPGPDAAILPGQRLTVGLEWEALRRSADDYELSVRLIGPGNRAYADDRAVPRTGFVPTTVWLPGDRESTRHQLAVPADAPPGRYWVQVGFRPYRTRPSLAPLENMALLGPLKIVEPQRAPQPQHVLTTRFGSEIELLGYDFLDHGESLALHWRALERPASDYTLYLHLLDAGQRLIGQVDSPPRAGEYPTSLWSAGEYVTDVIELPEVSGARTIRLGLYRPDTGERLPTASGADSVVIPVTDSQGGT